MFWKKKGLATALCLALCLVAFPVPRAMAAAPIPRETTEIMPRMEYINDARHTFDISDGEALMSARVRGNSGSVVRCEIVIELQKKDLQSWDTVETWSTTENGRSAVLNVTHEITSGETYRMVATVTVWSSNNSETQIMTSEEVTA